MMLALSMECPGSFFVYRSPLHMKILPCAICEIFNPSQEKVSNRHILLSFMESLTRTGTLDSPWLAVEQNNCPFVQVGDLISSLHSLHRIKHVLALFHWTFFCISRAVTVY
jgi:hypothetical protein